MQKKLRQKSCATGIRTRVAGSKVRRSTNWAIGAEKKIGQKIQLFITNIFPKMNLNSKVLLNKKFSNQFGNNFYFTKAYFCHLFSFVNFFLPALLQGLCLVNEKFSDQFLENFSFTIINFCHIFSFVNFFVRLTLLHFYLVTQKFFFKNSIPLLPFGAKWL